MDIYTNQICFVYKWTQLSTNKWYIGSHTSKTANPDDGYICSSKIVKPMIQENRNDWIRIILETGLAKDMVQLEHELLTCLNAAKSEYSYNKTNGGLTFANRGTHLSVQHRSAISKSSANRICSDQTRLKLSIAASNQIVSDATRSKLSNLHKGVPKSAEHISKMSSASLGKHKSLTHRENISKVQRGILDAVVQCPYCPKSGGNRVMHRWHFDNCKFNYQ